MKTIHLKPEKEHKCKECGKCFGMIGNLFIHMNGWVDLEMRKTLMQTGMWIIIILIPTENQSH